MHYVIDKVPLVTYIQSSSSKEANEKQRKSRVFKNAHWQELACAQDRVDIIVDKILRHFLQYTDHINCKAQILAVNRKECVLIKEAMDRGLEAKGMPCEWSDVIIHESQHDDKLKQSPYRREKQEDLIEYFAFTQDQWEDWNKERYGSDHLKWRPALKILILCDHLISSFDASIKQLVYIDNPLLDKNILQAIEQLGHNDIVLDYFGSFMFKT